MDYSRGEESQVEEVCCMQTSDSLFVLNAAFFLFTLHDELGLLRLVVINFLRSILSR